MPLDPCKRIVQSDAVASQAAKTDYHPVDWLIAGA